MSFRFALLMIIEIALWHREGMSSILGGSVSWSMLETWVGAWFISVLGQGSGCCFDVCDGCAADFFWC